MADQAITHGSLKKQFQPLRERLASCLISCLEVEADTLCRWLTLRFRQTGQQQAQGISVRVGSTNVSGCCEAF
jgi:DNA polymerase III delta subunit